MSRFHRSAAFVALFTFIIGLIYVAGDLSASTLENPSVGEHLPLYYALAAPIYEFTSESILVLRILSTLMVVGVIAASYFVGWRIFPSQPLFALAMALLVSALMAQQFDVMTQATSEPLAALLIAIMLVVAMGYTRNPTEVNSNGEIAPLYIAKVPHAAALGGLLGISYITSATLYIPATLIVMTAIITRWHMEENAAQWLIKELFWGMVVGIIIGIPVWVTYGFPQISVGGEGWVTDLWRVSSSMLMNAVIAGFYGASLLGLVLFSIHRRNEPPLVWPKRAALWILIIALATQLDQAIIFVLLPLAFGVTLGWVGWFMFIRNRAQSSV